MQSLSPQAQQNVFAYAHGDGTLLQLGLGTAFGKRVLQREPARGYRE